LRVVAVLNTSACLRDDASQSSGLSCSLRIREPRYFDLGALFGRVERIEARRRRYAPDAVTAPSRVLDAALLRQGRAFEAAWAAEVAALIALKRNDTPQARSAARRARAATARLARRIESARAASLAGLQVKARATLWRRNGEPLGRIDADVWPIRTAH
jgi:hypothetical protein